MNVYSMLVIHEAMRAVLLAQSGTDSQLVGHYY